MDESESPESENKAASELDHLHHSDIVTIFTHFYRAEVERVVTWRTRFDAPSYWAVTVMAGLLVITFSGFDTPHYILIIGMVTMLLFALIEAHRYRTYDIWRSRVRLLQENFFATAFDPAEDFENQHWREILSEDLRRPALKITFWHALGSRLIRIYLPLLVVLLAAWISRITVFTPEQHWVDSASVAQISGIYVLLTITILYALVFGIAYRSLPQSMQGEFHGATREWWGEQYRRK